MLFMHAVDVGLGLQFVRDSNGDYGLDRRHPVFYAIVSGFLENFTSIPCCLYGFMHLFCKLITCLA